jgi:hypothetical protein
MNSVLEGRVDFTDHGRPWDHPNPHYHAWRGPNGGWGEVIPLPWK